MEKWVNVLQSYDSRWNHRIKHSHGSDYECVLNSEPMHNVEKSITLRRYLKPKTTLFLLLDCKKVFCIHHVLNLLTPNSCPSVTGNGGTVFNPLKITVLPTFFQNWFYYFETHPNQLSFWISHPSEQKIDIKKIEKQRFFGNGGTGWNRTKKNC